MRITTAKKTSNPFRPSRSLPFWVCNLVQYQPPSTKHIRRNAEHIRPSCLEQVKSQLLFSLSFCHLHCQGGPIAGTQLCLGNAPFSMEAPAPPQMQPSLRAQSATFPSTESSAPPLTQPSLRARSLAPASMEPPAPPLTQPSLRGRSVALPSTEPPAPPSTQPSLRARSLAPASMEPPTHPSIRPSLRAQSLAPISMEPPALSLIQQRAQSLTLTSTEYPAPPSTQPTPRTRPSAPASAVLATQPPLDAPFLTQPTSRAQSIAPGSAPSAARPPQPRPPTSESAAFHTAAQSSSLPSSAGAAQSSSQHAYQGRPSASQMHALPASRRIADPREALVRLQGRSDKSVVPSIDRSFGSKTPATGASNSKSIHPFLILFIRSSLWEIATPYHRQMDDLAPPSPPAPLPPPKKFNPFAKPSARPKKG